MLSLPLSAPVSALKACLLYALDPLAYYSSRGLGRFAQAPANVRALLDADAQNRLMREESRNSAWTRAEAEALRAENERLRGLLGLKDFSRRSPLWAHVEERDPLRWHRSLTVDAGSDRGVVLNAPVLGPKGEGLAVVGRVVEVRPRSSVVRLVTDELSSVAAYLSSATVEGLVQGQGSHRLLMNYLPSDAVLDAGDLVFTSPTSATFPPDVLIGEVVKVNPRDQFLTYQSVEVEPAVDASSLTELMILKPQVPQSWRPEPQSQAEPGAGL